MKTLYIECGMGAAGDMLLAALYELLEDKERFLAQMNGLGLPGVGIQALAAHSCGIAGTHMKVTVNGEEEGRHGPSDSHGHQHLQEGGRAHHRHSHATPGDIGALLDGLRLEQEVKAHARAVYDAIAQAEARAHGCPVGEVHFHEVGALDAVADVTGVCYALHLLGVERVVVSPIHVGSGTVRCAHGVMPVPAPATAALLTGVPIYAGSVDGELCTPTGAALLVHFADGFGPMPMMAVQRIGIGIGSKAFDRPNCVRAFLGESMEQGNGAITELVCNLDDMTPEALSFACTRLLELGALDVYTVAGTMKKGRSGHILTVLCEERQEEETARRIFALTTTNGLRVRRCGKYFLTPGQKEIETRWGTVRAKLAEGFGVRRAKPEFDDTAALAREHRLSYQAAAQEVLRSLPTEEKEGTQ